MDERESRCLANLIRSTSAPAPRCSMPPMRWPNRSTRSSWSAPKPSTVSNPWSMRAALTYLRNVSAEPIPRSLARPGTLQSQSKTSSTALRGNSTESSSASIAWIEPGPVQVEAPDWVWQSSITSIGDTMAGSSSIQSSRRFHAHASPPDADLIRGLAWFTSARSDSSRHRPSTTVGTTAGPF